MLLSLCSRGLLPSCHGSFPASSCVHSVHETLFPGFHRPHLFFKPLRYRLGLLVFPSRQRSTSRRHCRRGSWHLSVFTVERLAVFPCCLRASSNCRVGSSNSGLSLPSVGHATFGYRSVVSATVQDIYQDRLQVVTLPVPINILARVLIGIEVVTPGR